MCPEELVSIVTALAIAISKDKSTDEIDLLAIVFTQLSDTLITISAQKQLLKPKEEDE
jgi:hypothetical protein